MIRRGGRGGRVVAVALALVVVVGCRPRRDGGKRELPPISKREPVEPRTADGATLEYTLRFPAPHTHYVEVEAVFPTAGADPVELMMAVWTPGSYLVREYSRHVEALSATTVSGDPLDVSKTHKNRWQVAAGGADRVVVRYRVYAREMSVRTNFVDAELAIINGAPTFLTLADGARHPHDVAIELPAAWSHAVTALPAHPDGAANRYLAGDYDQLVDSPIVAGNPTLHEFAVEEVPHVLANFGEGWPRRGADDSADGVADAADAADGVDGTADRKLLWDGARSAADVAAIVRAQVSFWRTIPYSRYVFLNVLSGGGGGLEHKDSTLMLASPWMMRKRSDYTRWLGLVSHEFFHTWNIKRLRPATLGPFDYERENYTPSLWIVEGLTSFYDDVMLARAGLLDRDEYLETLSVQIKDVQTTPGRLVQPLGQASFDAWIKFYRPDENSNNTSISYYRKGAVVGFLLDAEIRRATGGARSLDDVMRLAYERYAGETGYTPEQFRAVVDEVAGVSLAEFFRVAVDSTEELDYEPALSYYGLEFEPVPAKVEGEGGEGAKPNGEKPDDAKPDDAPETTKPGQAEAKPGWLGASVNADGRVTRIERDTPAHAAGINAEDELLAIDGYRVTGADLEERLARYRPGERVTVLVARRGRLIDVPVTLAVKPAATWKLQVAPKASRRQQRRLDALLSSQL